MGSLRSWVGIVMVNNSCLWNPKGKKSYGWPLTTWEERASHTGIPALPVFVREIHMWVFLVIKVWATPEPAWNPHGSWTRAPDRGKGAQPTEAGQVASHRPGAWGGIQVHLDVSRKPQVKEPLWWGGAGKGTGGISKSLSGRLMRQSQLQTFVNPKKHRYQFIAIFIKWKIFYL